MKIKIITIGKPDKKFKDLFEFYFKRLNYFFKVEKIHLKDNKNKNKNIIEKVGNDFFIVLDEKGREFNSYKLAEFIEKKNMGGVNLSFLIGGDSGHDEEIIKKADLLFSLSKLTFPHDLAMVILVESLYRAGSIIKKHPYHRGN